MTEDLVISWTSINQKPQPGDKIILLKDGCYLREVRPSDHHGSLFETEVTMPSQDIDLGSSDEYEDLEQECLGPFSVEWIDKDGNLIAVGCMKTNSK